MKTVGTRCNIPFARYTLCKAAIDATIFAILASVAGRKFGELGVQVLGVLSVLKGERRTAGEWCRGSAGYRRWKRDAGNEGSKNELGLERHGKKSTMFKC